MYSLKQELRWHINNGCKVYDRGGAGLGPPAETASPDSTTTNSSNIRHSSGSGGSTNEEDCPGVVGTKTKMCYVEGAAAS